MAAAAALQSKCTHYTLLTQSSARLRRLQRPAALLYGLRPAPPFGRCIPPLTRPPKGACPFATWQGCRWPRRFALLYLPPCLSVGRSVSVKAMPRRGRCASLDPASTRYGAGVKGLVRPAARRARTRPLDACGVTPASGSGVGNEGSAATAGPSPRASRRRVWGVQRGKAPLGLAQRKQTLPPLARH